MTLTLEMVIRLTITVCVTVEHLLIRKNWKAIFFALRTKKQERQNSGITRKTGFTILVSFDGETSIFDLSSNNAMQIPLVAK